MSVMKYFLKFVEGRGRETFYRFFLRGARIYSTIIYSEKFEPENYFRGIGGTWSATFVIRNTKKSRESFHRKLDPALLLVVTFTARLHDYRF